LVNPVAGLFATQTFQGQAQPETRNKNSKPKQEKW